MERKCNNQHTFIRYQTLICQLLKESKGLTRAANDDRSIQGNELAIRRKMKGLAKGTHEYEKDPTKAVAYNDNLIE